MTARRRAPASLRRMERASGALATQAVARMDQMLPWFAAMPAEQRSWVGLVVQAGVTSFVDWVRRPGSAAEITGEVFRTAPRAMARSVSLPQVVDFVRVAVEVVEARVPELAAPGEEAVLRDAVLRYSREIAFATARVYASAAEERGAWDARLEALVVDALVREEPDDSIASRAAALGWGSPGSVSVLVGYPAEGEPEFVLDQLHRTARHHELDVLAGIHGDRLVAVMGGSSEPLASAGSLLAQFGSGPVVLGPPAPELAAAGRSARAALAGLRAVAARPECTRPVLADDLLPERALAGDIDARLTLVESIYIPLRDGPVTLLDTVSAYVESGRNLEATARALFLHPNTVRYRLRKATGVCGLAAGNPRDAFTLHIALLLGRLTATDMP